MLRYVVALAALLATVPAQAATICIVDFQQAVNETDEGKAAQTRLDTMYESKKNEIEKMRQSLEADLKDYQSRSLILSPEARQEQEQAIAEKQMRFEQTYMQYQQEMQQTYYTMLQDLDTKMRAISEKLAKDKGYDLVIDRAAVVYMGGDTVDMTDELVKRYNTEQQ